MRPPPTPRLTSTVSSKALLSQIEPDGVSVGAGFSVLIHACRYMCRALHPVIIRRLFDAPPTHPLIQAHSYKQAVVV